MSAAVPELVAGRLTAPRGPAGHGTRLALAIALLWGAGFCFWIAFSAGHRVESPDSPPTITTFADQLPGLLQGGGA